MLLDEELSHQLFPLSNSFNTFHFNLTWHVLYSFIIVCIATATTEIGVRSENIVVWGIVKFMSLQGPQAESGRGLKVNEKHTGMPKKKKNWLPCMTVFFPFFSNYLWKKSRIFRWGLIFNKFSDALSIFFGPFLVK